MANTALLPSTQPFASQPPYALSKFPALTVPALPLLTAGLRRGGITEITGARSSGRMTLILHLLAQATAGGEVCAVVDTDNQFHPASAVAAGVNLGHVVWVRCDGNSEHAMRVADLLLHAGGFGLVLLDLCEVNTRVLNRIPFSYWYRFRRAIEQTATVLVVCSSFKQTKAHSHHLELKLQRTRWKGQTPFSLLQGLDVSVCVNNPQKAATQQIRLERTA